MNGKSQRQVSASTAPASDEIIALTFVRGGAKVVIADLKQDAAQ